MHITDLDRSRLITDQNTADSADNSPFRSHYNIGSNEGLDIVTTAATIAVLLMDLHSFECQAARFAVGPKEQPVH